MTTLALSLALAAIPADKAAHAMAGAIIAQLAAKGLCAMGSELRTGDRGLPDRHRPCRWPDLFFGAVVGTMASVLKEQLDQVYGNGADNNDALAGTLGALVGVALVVEF